MRRLSSLILLQLLILGVYAQSPHGESLKLKCSDCHDPASWNAISDSIIFNHNTTDFPLEETHLLVDCKTCHSSLVFEEASSQCVTCHSDVHSMTVGNDCARCHTSRSWLVDYIPELHEENGFPLIGSHGTLSCADCHVSETSLRFDRIGNDCLNCHMDDYSSTQNPNHGVSGFSTNCIDCHNPYSNSWETDFIDHGFFPLIFGHDVKNCTDCHKTGNFSNTSPECVSCHQNDYSGTNSPNHNNAGFSTNCAECHNISAWQPSTWNHDDEYPLLGHHASISKECMLCHAGGYDNTPNTCVGCHLDDYNGTTSPNHKESDFSTDCVECHGEYSWVPSSWNHEPLNGYHASISKECMLCHASGYTNTPTTCVGCHLTDYNNATNPNHAPFNTNCAECHTETSWVPSTFDHDANYFPIYSGKHNQEWNDCIDCHTNSSTYSTFSCINCHEHSDKNKVDNDHVGKIQNPPPYYTYTSAGCFECHPLGKAN